MRDIRLFRLGGKAVQELEGRSAAVEKSIQTLLGTGDLEITLKNRLDLEQAKPLMIKSYESS